MTEKKAEDKEASRRQFIKGTVMGGVAGAVLGAVTGGVMGSTIAPPGPTGAQGPPGPPGPVGTVEEPKWDADLLVVGSGEAGMFAAINAADEGAKVILLEKFPDIMSSSSWISGGSISGACTKMQIAGGVLDDSPWEHYKDIMKIGRYKQDPDLVRVFVENAGVIVDWLDALGVPFKDHKALFAPAHELYSKMRSYWPDPQGSTPSGGVINTYIQKELQKRIDRGDVKRLFETRAKTLIKDDSGTITGAKADDAGGKEVQYLAKATILATGGFVNDRKARKDFAPWMENVISKGAVSATGDGLYMATGVGAGTACLSDEFLTAVLSPGAIPDPKDPTKSTASVNMIQYPGPIWVDKNGKRFYDEGTSYEVGRKEATCKNVADQTVFVILDEGIKTANKDTPIAFGAWNKFDEAAKAGELVKMANTIEELAGKLGIDAAALKNTVDKYNGYVTAGKDPDFGRTELKYKIATPPFYGIKTIPSSILTRGGLVINTRAEVLDTKGKIIPGLYAAGEVVAQSLTSSGIGSISGGANTTAMVFGRLAGIQATKYAQATYHQRAK